MSVSTRSVPRVDEPVCGSDRQDYPNQCLLESMACKKSNDVTMWNKGRCGGRDIYIYIYGYPLSSILTYLALEGGYLIADSETEICFLIYCVIIIPLSVFARTAFV